jgi:hypothetical protein
MRGADETTPVDVEIVHGEVPAELGDSSQPRGEYDICGSDILLREPQVGRFLVRDGKRIVIDAQTNADKRLIRGALAGPALATLLHQRKAMPLHASCVARDGRAIAFVGDSGAGKSTTAMLFRNRGYEIITDDIVTCHTRPSGATDQDMAVNPAGRSPKLWHDAAGMLGTDGMTADAEYGGTAKKVFTLPPAALESAPRLDAVFILRWIYPPDAEPEVIPLGRLEALALLRKNIYRDTLVGVLGLEGEYMARLAALLRTVPVFAIARAHSVTALPDIHPTVEQALGYH